MGSTHRLYTSSASQNGTQKGSIHRFYTSPASQNGTPWADPTIDSNDEVI